MTEIELFKCSCKETIIEAMERIDQNTQGVLYIVDNKDALVGCLTDGNVRRWIIKDGRIDVSVQNAMNPDPVYILREEYDYNKAIEMMRKYRIFSIPVIDRERHIFDILFLEPKAEEIKKRETLENTPVIIMAGGKGTRLYPYTKILPKPLIPVGNVPIIERIMNRFAEYGANDFFLTVNYRKEMIKSYFAETKTDYSIHFVEEEMPLGTAGSIGLIEETFYTPIVVTNCDILIDANYEAIMNYHRESGNDLTIVSAQKKKVIPYGVLEANDDGVITSMQEKPEISYYVNTGMYIMEPEYISWIPTKKPFNMTELADELMKKGKQVGMYSVSENAFLDMGEFVEMKRMEERINAGLVEE